MNALYSYFTLDAQLLTNVGSWNGFVEYPFSTLFYALISCC